MSAANLQGVLLGMGNPLLDISATVEQDILDKYDVKLNNAILAEEKHLPVYAELVEKYNPQFIAGGATQNSIRVCQWMLQAEGATSFIGCVGKDEYAAKLRTAAEADGVHVSYLEDESTPTGTCACLIKDQERSLIANLAAANNYKLDHLQTEESKKIVEAAKYYYISGFFLTVSPPSIMEVAKHAHANGKTFAMNLSAPFITQFFADPLNAALPYVDILFGNESEAEAFGKQHGYDDLSVEGIAKKIANLPKENADKPRIVIITQGSNATVVATGETVTSYPVPSLEKDAIVDSNGAGDAFVGGFLSQLVQGKSIESAVNAGHYSAGLILGVSGTVLSGKPKTDF